MLGTNFFIFLLNVANLFGTSFQGSFGAGLQLPRKTCDRTVRVLNDCNWCTCNEHRQFICASRDCSVVDKFEHFNDAIKDINVGMEGHGYWRSRQPSCQPNVHYAKNNLLCVCTEEGNWPSTVCDEIFRVLHPVLVTALSEPSASQTCTPSTLYLVGCNVCFCPTSGSINPELCTKRACSLDDPVVKPRSELEVQVEAEEVYAECDAESSYRLGCRTCKCLRNNRLECTQCANGSQADCTGRKPGESFMVECNYCMCNEQGRSLCTMMNCAGSKTSLRQNLKEFTTGTCKPGKWFKKKCNHCYCYQTEKGIFFTCTKNSCKPHRRRNEPKDILELQRVCTKDSPLCFINDEIQLNLDPLNANCQPSRDYRMGCNKCKCLADGKTMRCTRKVCNELEIGEVEEKKPAYVDLLPVRLSAEGQCPKGHSFKLDCNYCFCLNNGNALCTTVQCRKRKWALD